MEHKIYLRIEHVIKFKLIWYMQPSVSDYTIVTIQYVTQNLFIYLFYFIYFFKMSIMKNEQHGFLYLTHYLLNQQEKPALI